MPSSILGLGVLGDILLGSTLGSTSGTTVTGSAGIPSAEAFGATGESVTGPITGAAGIPSAEAFPTTGALVSGYIGGVAGIPSAEAFGDDGFLTGPIVGAAGIPSGEAFGSSGESVTGPIVGAAGIPSAEAFGSPGSVTGPIVGSAGIPSAEAFGSGALQQPIIGSAGIISAEAFGAGNVVANITGYIGIPSAEAFGRSGTVTAAGNFSLLIRGREGIYHLKADTMTIQKEMASRSSASFTLRPSSEDGSTLRPCRGDEVIYIFKGRRIFGGFVTTTQEHALDSTDIIEIKVSCVGYRKLAESRTWAKTYTGSSFSMASIVGDLFEATLAQEGISYDADEDLSIAGKRFPLQPEKTVDQHLDYIGSVFGADWMIDDYRRLRINRRLLEAAPWPLEDDGMRASDKLCIWRRLNVTRSDQEYRNRQGLQTGVPVSGQQVSTVAGNGGYSYTLGYAVTGKPSVKVNGTAKIVVEAAEITEAPYDFYYTLNSNILRHNPIQAAYISTDSIVVTAPSASLDVYYLANAAEIARRAARTGGTGLVEVITPALGVRDQAAAASMAAGMHERFGAESERIEWESDAPFWDIGQMVAVRVRSPLVAGLFSIEGVSIREVGCTYLTYTVRATGFTLPMIVGLTIEEGAEPGSWEIEIEIDRPHGIDIETPGITIWGIDGLEPIWGTHTVDPIDPNTLHFTIPAIDGIDLTGIDYTGGLGGTGGGGVNGYNGTEEPFGGVIFSGLPPAPTVDPRDGTTDGIGEKAFVVTNVNINTNEVTLSEDHGWTSSFPTDNGFRVAIWGVKGTENPVTTFSINHMSTRVQVTATNKFIAADVGPLSGAPGFVDNGAGRAMETERIVRFAAPASPLNTLKMFFAAATPGENLAIETATFVLSSAIPGIASRPLYVASNYTNPWIAERDITVLESVSATIATPADGAPVLIDIKKNGSSIFAAGTYLEIGAGVTDVVRQSTFAETPLVVERGDKFTVDVVGVGSEFPGCNATVHLNMRG